MRRPARPRLWARLLSVAALLGAAYFALVPRTALYYVGDDGHPYDVEALYSWNTGGDQTILGDFSDLGGPPGAAESVRLGCGTAFTPGAGETSEPGGPEACSAIETPRRVGALVLLVLGVAGLATATRLPEPRSEDL